MFWLTKYSTNPDNYFKYNKINFLWGFASCLIWGNIRIHFIFVAPKKDLFGEHAYEALKQAIQRFGTDYIDLYLIHFPGYFPLPEPNMNFSALRDETWKQLVKGQKEGLVRNIGVSNYNIRQLKELLRNDHGVKPAINQVSKI